MITRLPRWVWPVAWLLAFVAGIANAVGLLGVAGEAVTHLTGTTTLAAAALADGRLAVAVHLATIAAAFVAGSVAGGALIPVDPLRLVHRHSLGLLLVAALLLAAVALFRSGAGAGSYFAAAACGLQNAMTTTYSGAVVRTSHVTGMFTDLGIALGHVLRGGRVDRRRLWLCATVIAGFFAGGGVATVLHARLGYDALLLAAAIVVALAAANSAHVVRRD